MFNRVSLLVVCAGLLPHLALHSPALAQQWSSSDPNSAPAKYVGSLHVFYRNGQIKGSSGVLVGRKHVLTAAHNLFDRDAKWAGRPESEWKPVTMMFTPGTRGRSSPFGSANATKWLISVPFLNNEDQDRDFGIIRLNRDLATRTGGFASMAEWPNEWTMDVTVYGYKYNAEDSLPRKIAFRAYNTTSWTQSFRGWHQFYSSSGVSNAVASASGGASGGPAIARGGTTNGKVVGVFNGIRTSVATNRLRGFRLSNVPLNEIRAWIAANP